MLIRKKKNSSDEREEIALSRRSFFSRLAVGTVLSMAVPGVVNAAKKTAVKDDKTHRSSKSAARLPKHTATSTKAVSKSAKVSKNHTSAKVKSVANANSVKSSTSVSRHNVASKVSRNIRVKDTYASRKSKSGKNVATHFVSNQQQPSGRTHSIIRPGHKDPIIETAYQPSVLADRGRFHSHRALSFQNPHTGERLSLTYFEKGRYLTDALNEINFLLRDHRTDEVHAIDPALLDQLYDLKQMLALQQPFDIICGYRSPMTNARLHAERSGVANNSFHIYGRAVDIRIQRYDLRRIHNAALAMHRGGVGYYPNSNFVHLDTGTFRTWSL